MNTCVEVHIFSLVKNKISCECVNQIKIIYIYNVNVRIFIFKLYCNIFRNEFKYTLYDILILKIIYI